MGSLIGQIFAKVTKTPQSEANQLFPNFFSRRCRDPWRKTFMTWLPSDMNAKARSLLPTGISRNGLRLPPTGSSARRL